MKISNYANVLLLLLKVMLLCLIVEFDSGEGLRCNMLLGYLSLSTKRKKKKILLFRVYDE